MTRRAAWTAGVALSLLTVAAGIARFRHADGVHLGDLPVYEHAARLMALGRVPYRDFAVEYPPGGAGLFGLTEVLPGRYSVGFAALMLLFAVATIGAVIATARVLGYPAWRAVAGAGLVPTGVWLLKELPLTRYDLAVTALLAWIVFCAVTNRWTWVWVLMAAAVLMKLVPLALAPALLVANLHAAGVRRTVRSMAPGTGLVVAAVLPFVAIAPGGLWDSVAYHLDRPLQVESTASAILLGLHRVSGLELQVARTYGSDNLVGALPDALAGAGSLMGIAVALLLVVLLHRRLRAGDAGPGYLVATLAATLAVLVASGKVLSPQYLLWLIPLVALLPGRRGPAGVALLVAAMALTRQVFPGRFRDLVEGFAAEPVWLLLARNALLVLLVVVCWPRGGPRRDSRADGIPDASPVPTTVAPGIRER